MTKAIEWTGLAARLFLLAVAVALGVCAGWVAPTDSVAAGSEPEMGPAPFERELGLLEPEARERWPESFAGVWGSAGAKPNRIYVAFVGDARRKVRELVKGFSDPDVFVPVSARYSLAHLERLHRRMVAEREAARGADNPIQGLVGAQYELDISLKENAVEAIVPADVETARAAVTQAYGNPSEPGADDVRVVRGERSRPLACSDRAHCGLELRAGLKVLHTQGQASSFCTSAFVVTTPGGATQMLSAAHCAGAGDLGNARYHRGDIIPANLYGSVQSQVYGGRVDAERHSIGNGFTGNSWVFRTQDVQASPVYSVGTWDSLIVDHTRLCKAGVTTGYTCGYLRSKYFTPGIPNGERFLAVQLEPNNPSYPGGSYEGDSGAPFVRELTPTQAEGILHGGGGGACGCWTIAGHIQYATQALGVTVKLSPTPPPPPVWPSDNLGGNIDGDPAISSQGLNQLDLLARGGDGALWHRYWNGTTWSNWGSLGGVLAPGSGAGSVSWNTNRHDVVTRGVDNGVWHWSWGEGGNGGAPATLGGYTASDPAISSKGPGQLEIFIRGADNALWTKSFSNGSWSGWQSLGGQITSGPGAVSWGSGRTDVVARGTDNGVWHWYWDGSWHLQSIGGSVCPARRSPPWAPAPWMSSQKAGTTRSGTSRSTVAGRGGSR